MPPRLTEPSRFFTKLVRIGAKYTTSISASVRSIPALTPADVHTEPSRMKIGSASTRTAGAGAGFYFKTKTAEKEFVVTTEKAVVKTITQMVNATGKIQPEVEVKISPEAPDEVTPGSGMFEFVTKTLLNRWGLVRFGNVWDDVRTVLLLVVLMFLATSVTFDDVLPPPVLVTRWSLPSRFER
mgnify:CR=1 FL=1